MCLEEAAK
jgi:hypothetical protein